MLKLGHHGSRFYSSEALLKTFTPKIGLVSAGADNSEGNGLGLAIVKSLVELMNGSIRVIVDGDLFKVEIRFPKIS